MTPIGGSINLKDSIFYKVSVRGMAGYKSQFLIAIGRLSHSFIFWTTFNQETGTFRLIYYDVITLKTQSDGI